MKSTTLTLLSSLAFALAADAITHAVLPGKSIQAKINLAVAGDIVAIFGGTYNEDLTINKAIRLVEVSGQQVILNGNIAFSGIVDCPPLDGFAVSSSGRGITLTDTTGMVLSNLDMPSGTYVNASASPIRITNCRLHDVTSGGGVDFKMTDAQLSGSVNISGAKQVISNVTIAGSLTQGAGVLEVSQSTIGRINQLDGILNASNVTVTYAANSDWGINSEAAAEKMVLYRVKSNSEVRINAHRAWIGYSTIKGSAWLGWWGGVDAKWVVVATEIDRMNNNERSGLLINASNGAATVTNCYIHDIRGHGDDGEQDNAIEIINPSKPVLIQNNYLHHAYEGYEPASIQCRGSGNYANVIIRNNYIYNGHSRAVRAQFGALIEGNILRGSNDRPFYIDDGAVGNENIKIPWESDPGFGDTFYVLKSDSILKNAGTNDPRYNDRDGSRNDIGPSGGAWFDPDGWTTENPVVISFDLSPDAVLEGVDTEVILSEGQAVSAP